MYAFLWLHIWDLILYGIICFWIILFCELSTDRKMFFGHTLIADKEFKKELFVFLLISVLLPPISWILAIYVVSRRILGK